jgi:hypothetical protein
MTATRLSRARQWTAIACLLVAAPAVLAGQRSDTAVVGADSPRYPGVGSLIEEVTLGAGSTAEEYQFTAVRLWSAPDGGVFVVDVGNPLAGGPPYQVTVRRYDRTGRFIRAYGRPGQGPGEFRSFIRYLQNAPDGRVLLLDTPGIHVYSAAGESLGLWPVTPAASRLAVDPEGFVLAMGDSQTYRRPRAEHPQPFLIRLRMDGSSHDVPTAPLAGFPGVPRIGNVLLPFAPRYVAVWSPLGYFVTANTAAYAVDLRLPRAAGISAALWTRGDPVRSIRRSVAPTPVAAGERGDWRQSLIMHHRANRSTPNWDWTGPDIPQVKPHIRDLFVSDEGRIWVKVSQPARLDRSVPIRTIPATPRERNQIEAERRWREPPVFDVFEPTGQYVGRIRFPDDGAQPGFPHPGYAIRGDTVWGAVHDADGVPSVKRYRVNWGGS